MSKIASANARLNTRLSKIGSVIKSANLRLWQQQTIALVVIYSILLQTLFFALPQTMRAQSKNQPSNLKSEAKEGYLSNFASRFAGLFSGDGEQTPAANSTEAAALNNTATAFGPKKFLRTKGAPNNYVETFTMPAECSTGIYKLVIRNGEESGINRISSAEVRLNGVTVFTQSEFNQNIYLLEKPVTLLAENTLEIRLTSPPNSYLSIDVRGENCEAPVDTIPPKLVITSPEDNRATTAAAITLTGTAEDTGANASGIAGVWVGGVAAAYNATTKIWELAAVPLSVGTNVITVKTLDNGGNESTSQVTVIRDLTNPQVSIASPSNGAVTLNTSIAVSGNAADAGADASGIARVTVNGAEAVLDLLTGAWTLADFSLAVGGNTVTAIAFDRAGNQASAQLSITRAVNQPPQVSAGADQTIELPAAATLSGTASDDGYPAGGLSVSWTKISGDGSVAFSNPNALAATANFSQAGTYVLRLTVSDGALAASDDLTVVVNPENHAPVVSAGADQTVVLPNTATLNGTATDDGNPAGSSLSVSWTKISGDGSVSFANANSAATTAGFSQPGIYVLRLAASDGARSATDDLTITVHPENQAPTANAGSDQTVILPNAAVLTGAAADDGFPQEGGSLTFAWSKVSGAGEVNFANPGSLQTSANFTQPGSYVLRLTVSDSELSASDDIVITVLPANQPPTVNAGDDQTISLPSAATLTGAASDDGYPQGSSLSVVWSKVSGGGTATFADPASSNTSVSFDQPGVYVLRLTATDGELSSFDELTVAVNPANQAPVVGAGDDQTIALPNFLQLNGTATDDGFPAGGGVAVSWSKVSGPGEVNFISPNAVQTAAGFSAPGVYVLRLSATDAQLSAEDEVTITVNPRPQCFDGDNFNDNAIDLTKWVQPLPGTQVYERNQRLEIVPFSTPYTIGGNVVYNGYGSALNCDFTGVITTVEVAQATPSVYHVETDFRIYGDSQVHDNNKSIGFAAGGGNLVFFYYVDGVATRKVINFNPAQHRFWRITHNPYTDKILWETSTDNLVWTTQWEVSRPFALDAMKAGLTAGTYLPLANPGMAAFDNFTIRFFDGRNDPSTNQAPTVNAGADQATSTETGNQTQLYTVNADGTNLTRLTFTAAEEQASQGSPDGTKILFSSSRDGNLEVYVMNADGSAQTRLTNHPAEDVTPFWSPDGTKIYFSSGRTGNRDLYSMNTDGSSVVQLTSTADTDYYPRRQPLGAGVSGDKIAFLRIPPGNNNGAEIWIMNADGSGQQKLTNNSFVDDVPVWSPDGAQLAFMSTRDGNIESYIMNADGTNVIRISNHPAEDWVNDWSPDGKYITYTSNRTGDYEVYTFRVADGTLTRLTYNPALDYRLYWSSDSSKVVFSSNRQGVYLQGSVIDDGLPPGSPIGVNWTKISGPGAVTFSTPAAAGTNARFSLPGTYVLRLTADDGQASGYDEVSVEVAAPPANRAPIVAAGSDREAQTGVPVALTGTVGDDGLPLLSAVATQWTKISGPGTVSFGAPNAALTSATFSAAGTYVLRLTASDGELSAFDEVSVMVSQSNQSPAVFAGADQTISLPATAVLNGTVNDDGLPVGAALSVNWSKISGPGEVLFADPAQPSTTVSFRTAGVYVLRLTASDSVLTGSDEVRVTVNSTASSRTVLEFISAEATDATGQTYTVKVRLTNWSNNLPIADKPVDFVLNGARLSAQTDSSGVAQIELTPTAGTTQISGMAYFNQDAALYSSLARVIFPVRSGVRTSTVAVFQENFDSEEVTQQALNYNNLRKWQITRGSVDIFGNALASGDGTGMVLDLDGTTAAAARLETRNAFALPAGDYTFYFKMGGNVNNPSDQMTVSIGSVFNETFVLPGTVSLDTPVRSFTLGAPTTGVLTYDHAGGDYYGIFLDQILLVVTSEIVPNQAPQVSAGADQTIALPDAANLSGEASDDGLPTGNLTAAWSKISGAGDVAFADPNSAATTATFSAAGTYVLRLTATDGELSAADDVTVTVSAPANQPPTVSAGEDKIIALPNKSLQFVQNNLAQFNQLAGAPPVAVDFDAIAPGTDITNTTRGGILFELANTPAPSAPLIVVKGADTFTPAGFSGVSNAATNKLTATSGENVLSPGGTELAPGLNLLKENDDLKITLAEPVAAIGFDVLFQEYDFYSAVAIKIYDPQGVILYQNGNLPVSTGAGGGAPGGKEFFGFVSGRSNIKTIVIDESDDNSTFPDSNIGFDSFRVQKVLPNAFVTLNGSVADDGLPSGILTANWTKISGPGTATFIDAAAPVAQATFSEAGTYVLRLTGSDGELTAFDEVTVTAYNTGQQPANQPPSVNAGSDQTISLPNAANLFALVTDDGMPAGSSVAVSWSKVSGAGNVAFSNAGSVAPAASFSAPGVYVLRITATDSVLTTSDDLTVTVNPPATPTPTPTVTPTPTATPTPTVTPTPTPSPTPQNQSPTVSAGDDQTTRLNANLIKNGGAESDLIGGELADWTEAAGTNWTRLEGGQNNVPAARLGNFVFSPGDAAAAEMRQDVDVRGFAQGINAGTQEFILQVSLRSAPEAVPDTGRIVVEYRDHNLNPIAALDSGVIGSTNGWHLTEDVRVPPAGTGFIRVRVIAARNSGATTDVYFDAASFKAIGNVAAVKLNGAATDDGLPANGALQKTWTKISGDGSVSFAAPNAVDSAAVFDAAGTYVLRLTATDGEFSAADDMTVTVNPPNQTPQISAGVDQTISLPATAQLAGAASDDGASVFARWTKVSGAGIVSFSDAKILNPTVSFSLAGTYVLRLTADDGELETADDITITVNPAPVNQPPAVDPGANQTITLPANSVSLAGAVTDDGLPNGNLTINWTKTSGAGSVSFAAPNSATTTATFSAAGSYILRLTASDGQYTAWREVVVAVYPEGGGGGQNQPPTVNAGTDQTVTVGQTAILEAAVADDGLPAGGSFSALWTKVSGAGNVNFSNPNQTATYATFSQTGTYVVRLTVSDSAASASDDLTVTVVENQPAPTVEILTPEDGASVNEPTVFTGTVSDGAWTLDYSYNDSDDLTTRAWTTINTGSGAASGNLGALDTTLMLNGMYDVRLTTVDQFGRTFYDLISVSVEHNLKIGHFTVSFEDMSVPVAGIPIQIIRTYDSRDKRKGDFGFGWRLGIKNVRVQRNAVLGLKWYQTRSNTFIPTYCVEATKPHIVTVTMPDGTVEKFEARTERQCQQAGPISETRLIFTPQTGTRGQLSVLGDNTVFVAGSVPGPVELIAYDGTGIFDRTTFKYTAKDGTEFVINQGAGLQSVKDPNGNTLTVSQNGITHSSGKSVTFQRDAQGRITHVTDPAGKSNVYTYDANGDLISYKDREENTTAFTYEATIAHHLKSIVDPLNRTPIRNEYDASGRLLKHTDADGNEILYTHNLAARVEIVTDRLGNPTTFEYDSRGNVLKKRDALNNETVYSYDANDNVLTETNALGKTTTYTYDAQDNQTSVTDPLGNRTEMTYNAKGQVLTLKDARNNVTTNTYDTAGNLLTTKDPSGNLTTHTYSIQTGDRATTKDALNHVTTFDHFSGYLIKQTDPQNNVTNFSYDAKGNLKTQTVRRTNAAGQVETLTTTFEFDDMNRLVKTIQPDGSFTRTEYNELGQESATIDQGGNRSEFIYDDLGRLIKTIYADGKFEESTFDAEGRRLTAKDRAGKVTTYQYDALGRLKKTIYADGTFTEATYDAEGQVLTSTDARANVTTYTYDDAGRRLTMKNALNQITSFTFDANGNQLSMTDALNHTTGFVYDALNRKTRTNFADASFTETTFDALGQKVAEKDQAGKTTEFVYDSLGRLTKVKDALNQETRYEYNELGQQIKQIDALNRVTKYEYDNSGRRVRRILPLGQTESYSYDADGNLQSKTDFNGKTTTFTYDDMRRLLSKTPDASLNQPAVTFTYNNLGQRATMSDASGTTVYGYDSRNRLASKQTPNGTLSYTYDDAGNIETLRSSNANGVSVDYDYDELNRLTSVKDNRLAGSQTTSYTFDTVGNLESYSYPNQVTTSYAYNNLNRLTTMTVSNPAGGLASYAYTLGAAGNRTQVTELSGRTVNYVYDDLYRLTRETIANSANSGVVNYQYDAVGNRLQRTSNVVQVANQNSTYDDNDRLNSDVYDNNGNTRQSNGKTYNYDFENKLTSTSNGITIVYDGDGNRVAKTVNGITTNYLVDTNNLTGYAQVVEEIVAGQVAKQYTYGLDLISQRQASGVSFYQYDGHGSVRHLTDPAAQVTDSYDYDAFGMIVNRTGTTGNNYLYAGEQFDADLGFYYNRARYLNVETGRFTSQDTFEGDSDDPLSLHKYLYANANAVNRIDPSGNMSFVELPIASLISQTIQAIGVMRNVVMTYVRVNQVVEKLRMVGAVLAIIMGIATASNNNDGFTADFPFKASTGGKYPDVKFGLERRVSANGNVNWIIRWQVDGKRVRLSLGDDPAAISGGVNYNIWKKETFLGEFGIDIAFRAGTEFNPQGRQAVGVGFEYKYKFLKYFSNTARIRFLSIGLQGANGNDNFSLGTDGQILE